MEDKILQPILQFLITATPLSVIALLGLIIFILVRGKAPSILTGGKDNTEAVPKATLASVAAQLEKIANNHLHDLPGIREDITKILSSQNTMEGKINLQSERMVRVETVLGIGVPEKRP